MPQTSYALLAEQKKTTSTMKALVFYGPGQIGLETVPIPRPRGPVLYECQSRWLTKTEVDQRKGGGPDNLVHSH